MPDTSKSVRLPRINAPAPDFAAKTTHGDRSLADYTGKWLVLFSHPFDFTPVCTTEFIGFAGVAAELKAMNCELLGLSTDSVFSHIAGTRNPPPKTTTAAAGRESEGAKYTDWYFSTRPLAA